MASNARYAWSRYADACNLFTSDAATGVARKLEILRKHCSDAGRDYAAIEKTILYVGPLPIGDAQTAFIKDMRAYHALGVARVMVIPGLTPTVALTPADEVAGLGPVVTALAAF